MNKYTISNFKRDFPNDDVCLDFIFHAKFPNAKGYYRMKTRKAYANSAGHQLSPLAGTIFHKSSTSLTNWFHAMFLFASSKNGVSAKELERQLGVTYKCAWRIAHQLRKLMTQESNLLEGIVEVDETYFGPKGDQAHKFKNKSALMGMVERKGRVRATKIEERTTNVLLGTIKANISKDAHVVTDEFKVYAKLPKQGYTRDSVKHSKGEYVRGNIHTNTIEGFWGQLKRSIRGTYHFVSAKHLQAYVDEFAFRYNLRVSAVPIFQTLASRAATR